MISENRQFFPILVFNGCENNNPENIRTRLGCSTMESDHAQ